MSQTEETQKFSDAFAALRQCVQAIEQAPEDDLDTVIVNVEKARQAKAVCEERLAAANQRLAELLGQEPAPR